MLCVRVDGRVEIRSSAIHCTLAYSALICPGTSLPWIAAFTAPQLPCPNTRRVSENSLTLLVGA
jgi:hypothetical protein